MAEERPVISSSRLTASDVLRHTFASTRKGFDAKEVTTYLELLARELQAWEDREIALRHELSEAEKRAANPVLDESTLSAALGQKSAQVLRAAHEEAARVMGHAEETAGNLVREATQQATETQIRAEQSAAERIAEAELSVGTVHSQVQQETMELLEAAKRDAESIVTGAKEQGLNMLEQAQAARKQILTDLVQRRRDLHGQIEQLRAARDELRATVLGVRDTVDQVVGDLAAADDAARAAAAEAAGQLSSSTTEEDLIDIEGVDLPGDEATPELTDLGGADDLERASNAATSAVDELFARIRAKHDMSGDVATAEAELAPASAPAAEEPHDEDEDEPPAPGIPPADQAQLDQRAALLDPVTTKLARSLKRALQDDQNRLLDRIRNGKGDGLVLLDEDEQRRLYVDAASDLLAEAFEAGAAFIHKQGHGAPGKVTEAAQRTAENLGSDLAGVVVTLLRRPLDGEELGADQEDAAQRASAAYREWRGERIERLVGDFALGAFSAGELESVTPESGIRWVIAAHGNACSDCDDNSLAGALAPGEEFPTGHRHPPAHAGCRCLIAPTTR